MSASVAAASIPMTGVRSGLWRNRLIALVLLATIGSIFWIDSRYPSLLKKYRAGTKVQASGAITFDMLYPVDASMPLQQRVWRTSINWLNANRIGMTFAFFFRSGSIGISSDTSPPSKQIQIAERADRHAYGYAAGCLRELRGADWARTVQIGDEHGISTGGNVQFARAECGGAGDDVRAVSVATGLAETRHGAGADLWICADDCGWPE